MIIKLQLYAFGKIILSGTLLPCYYYLCINQTCRWRVRLSFLQMLKIWLTRSNHPSVLPSVWPWPIAEWVAGADAHEKHPASTELSPIFLIGSSGQVHRRRAERTRGGTLVLLLGDTGNCFTHYVAASSFSCSTVLIHFHLNNGDSCGIGKYNN